MIQNDLQKQNDTNDFNKSHVDLRIIDGFERWKIASLSPIKVLKVDFNRFRARGHIQWCTHLHQLNTNVSSSEKKLDLSI